MLNLLCAEGANGTSIVVYVILIVALLFILVAPYFTQRKKNKAYTDMLGTIKVGDLVKTAGGIIGRVTKITDKGEIRTVVLETGSKTEKSYMEIDMNGIYCVLKSTKQPTTETVEETKEEVKEEKTEEVSETKAENETKTEEAKPKKRKTSVKKTTK